MWICITMKKSTKNGANNEKPGHFGMQCSTVERSTQRLVRRTKKNNSHFLAFALYLSLLSFHRNLMVLSPNTSWIMQFECVHKYARNLSRQFLDRQSKNSSSHASWHLRWVIFNVLLFFFLSFALALSSFFCVTMSDWNRVRWNQIDKKKNWMMTNNGCSIVFIRCNGDIEEFICVVCERGRSQFCIYRHNDSFETI